VHQVGFIYTNSYRICGIDKPKFTLHTLAIKGIYVTGLFCANQDNVLHTVHDHPLYLICPGLLSAIGETSYGIRVGFIGSTRSLHYLFMYLFVFEM
jgi:hypothetical protein